MNKENLRTEFREYLNETLPKIYFNNKELTWNPNKTEKDFKLINRKIKGTNLWTRCWPYWLEILRHSNIQ